MKEEKKDKELKYLFVRGCIIVGGVSFFISIICGILWSAIVKVFPMTILSLLFLSVGIIMFYFEDKTKTM